MRIALVLYGGVSLAIYIHGVTQELLRAVRATAPAAPAIESQSPLLDQLTPTEAIYRELGRRVGSAAPFMAELDPVLHRRVHTRFVIDVISGTSAGGINGVFLAKALANLQTLAGLRSLWIKEGDVELLLNDSRSVKDLPTSIRLERPPRALLNTRRMYYRLLQALDGLEQSNPQPPPESPLADEIDLYVTTTDIRGLILPIPLWDRTVYERRFRNVFHFLYAAERASGQWRNDFKAANNGFLAFASRATSSFPVAFEPMTLGDLRNVPPWNQKKGLLAGNASGWRSFYKDYLRGRGGVSSSDPALEEQFLSRAFGDGGYLDNKPFGYASDGLRERRSDRRILRKLFYVEPSPENPELETDSEDRPDPFENLAAAAFLLPRQETIREDIERVLDRNRTVARITDAIHCLDEDLRHGELPLLKHGEYAASGLTAMSQRYGPGYPTYHRTKVSQLTTEIAEVLMRLAGFNEDSGLGLAIRHMVRQWRMDRYQPDLDPNRPEIQFTENKFLDEFDLGYRVRRMHFLQERLDGLLAIVGREERRIGDARAAKATTSQESGAARRPMLRQQREGTRSGALAGQRREDLEKLAAILREDGDAGWLLSSEHLETFRSIVLRLKHELSEIQVDLRKQGRAIRSRRPGSRVVAAIDDTRITIEELAWVLETPLENIQRERAVEVLTHPEETERSRGRREKVNAVFDALAAEIEPMFESSRQKLLAFFAKTATPAGASASAVAIEAMLRRALDGHYRRFESYDSALFPLAWGTGIGELACVDIIRVSPEETTLLNEFHPRDGTRRFHKLAGTRLGSFGSFLTEAWRRSDILWGRLDGAERIIRSVLVAGTDQEEMFENQFILRAQGAILCEELEGLSEEECLRVVCQCLVRTTSGKAAPELLDEMMRKLHPVIESQSPDLARILEPTRLREFYLAHFTDERTLSPDRGARMLSRATRIMGSVLDGVSERYGPFSHRAGWILLWIGRTLWGLVEIALPRTWGSLVFRYWLSLLYLVGLVVVLGGMAFNWPNVRLIGIRLMVALLGLDLVRRLVRSLLERRLRMWTLATPILVAIAVAGVWTLARPIPGVEPWVDRQLTTVMESFRTWLEPLWQLGRRLCPKC